MGNKKVIQSKQNDSTEKMSGSTTQIKERLKEIELDACSATLDKRLHKIMTVLDKKNKNQIIEAVLEKYYNAEELKPYQAELIKMQRHLERTGKKMVVLFDGRDASGKGGTIR
ncbi:MAG: hypothetical protein R3274_08110, partial [Desulfobacterales bacterium]|nr:hypothetical protein [Desulfobacterales bacterium]